MADNVQFILDRMSSTLRHAEQLGVFSHSEIQSIVKKRTDYEYTLKRRQLEPADFYVYMKYELNLEMLREKRCFKLSEKADKEVRDSLRNLQAAFFRHTCTVFERALRRFPSEMSIWSDYIDFLKKKEANAVLNTIIGRALSLFPKKEIFWIEASSHEIQINNSAHAARALLQRSLRVNKSSRLLWSKYFELELWNLTRVYDRRKVLGIGDEIEESNGGQTVALSAPAVVFKYAVAALPGDIDFAFELYTASRDTAGGILVESILREMKKAYGKHPYLWFLLSTSEISDGVHRHQESAGDAALEFLDEFAAISNALINGIDKLFESNSFLCNEPSISPQPGSTDDKSKRSKRAKLNTGAVADPVVVNWSRNIDAAAVVSSALVNMLDQFLSSVITIAKQLNSEVGPDRNSDILVSARVLQKALDRAVEILETLRIDSDALSDSKGSLIYSNAVCELRLNMLLNFIYNLQLKASGSPAVEAAPEVSKKSSKKRKPEASDPIPAVSLPPVVDSLFSFSRMCSWLCSRHIGSAHHRLVSIPHANVLTDEKPFPGGLFTWARAAYVTIAYGLAACDSKHTDSDILTKKLDIKCCFDNSSVEALQTHLVELSSGVATRGASLLAINSLSHQAKPSSEDDDFQNAALKLAFDILCNKSFPSDSVDSVNTRKLAVTSSLQSIVRSSSCSADDRANWMCYYIKQAYSLSASAGRDAYTWCMSCVDEAPGMLSQLPSTAVQKEGAAKFTEVRGESMVLPVYKLVIETEGVADYLDRFEVTKIERMKGNDIKIDREYVPFITDVLSRAVRELPGDLEMQAMQEKLVRATGNHKLANHLRWRQQTKL